MKNKINFLYILIILFISFNSHAKFNKTQKIELKRQIFKTEQNLKEKFTKDLKRALGKENFILDVKIKVSSKNIYKEVTGGNSSLENLKEMQLPSLFLELDMQEKLKEIKEIKHEVILSHIWKMSIRFISSYEISDKDAFKEKLKEVISSNFNNIRKVRFSIKLKTVKNYLKSPNKKSTPKEKPIQKKDIIEELKETKPFTWLIFSACLLTSLLFLLTIKSSSSSIRSSINNYASKNKEIKVNLPAKKAEVFSKKKMSNNDNHNKHDSDHKNYQKSNAIILKNIKDSLNNNFGIIEKMIPICQTLGQRDHTVILLALLPHQTRVNLYKKMKPKDVKELKSYLIDHGGNLYSDSKRLYKTTKEISSIITLSLLEESNLYNYYLKNAVKNLDKKTLEQLIPHTTSSEFYYILNNTDSSKIGNFFLSSEALTFKWPSQYTEFDNSKAESFINKISKYITSSISDDISNEDSRLKLLPYLPKDIEKNLLKELKLGPEYLFENLVEEHFNFVLKSFSLLDIDELSIILSAFEDKTREKLISNLPEIMKERIEMRTIKKSSTPFDEKVALHQELLILSIKKSKDSDHEKNNHLAA